MPNTRKKLYTFEVQYFKASGKFYTSDSWECECTVMDGGAAYMYDATDKLRAMRGRGEALPGLSTPGSEFYIHINGPDGVPCLILPQDQDRGQRRTI